MNNNKTLLGIVCAHSRMSMTLMKGGRASASAWVDLDDNIMTGSEIKSENLFAAMIKDCMKKHGMKARDVAFAIPSANVFTRNITMPQMPEDQLALNIPFEFQDYISGELKDYYFDFAILDSEEAGMSESGEPTVELLAAAVPIEYIEGLANIFRMAGLRLVRAVPEILCFKELLSHLESEEERNRERCFLDIGMSTSRMLIYKGGHYKLTHMVDIGERRIIQTVADEMNVDMHLARTYLETEYEDCGNLEAVKNVYRDISLEVLKGINFYEVSDFTARLSDITLCGGGAMIDPLVELLKTRINMDVVTADEQFERIGQGKDFNVTAASYGLVASDTEDYTINFIGRDAKKTDWRILAPALAAIIVFAVLFSKFLVVDQFARLFEAQSEVTEIQNQIDESKAAIEAAGELTDHYYHYTWSKMTEEEKQRMSRVKVANLIAFIGRQTVSVDSYSVSGDTLTVNFVSATLKDAGRLARDVEKQSIVGSANVSTAQKGTGDSGRGVQAQLVVHIKSNDIWEVSR